MIRSLSNTPVHSLFSPETNVVYSVPKYQREYSWGISQWDNLFDDLLEAGHQGEHFLGTIICVNNTRDTTEESILEVIDGQQRLTTISLFLAAIFSILDENQDKLTRTQQKDFFNLESMLILTNSHKPRLRPQTQNSNAADYQMVLHEAQLETPATESPYAGIRRVKKGYSHFRSRLAKLAEETNQPTYEVAFEMLTSIKRATLVKIEVETQADAFVLFESLNNRGMPLTPIDLIKNTLLGIADQNRVLDATYEQWSEWLRILGDDYSIQERFFRYYYNAMKEKKELTVQGASLATRTNLIKIYETLMKEDFNKLLKNITDGAHAYGRLINPEDSVTDPQVQRAFRQLLHAQGSPAHLRLLFRIVKKETLGLDEQQLLEIARLLTAFFVRRNLTGMPATHTLQKLFIDIIQEIRKNPKEIKEIVRENLISISASDSYFKEVLHGPVYELNSDVVRFILVTLAESKMTKENEQNLWRKDNTKGKPTYRWSIEHILPQSENLHEDWVKMLGGNLDEAHKIQELYKHKLGNLTITGYNSSLGKKSFTAKRDHTDSEGRYIGYKNGLSLNENLATRDSWSQKDIEDRTDALAEKTISMFSLTHK